MVATNATFFTRCINNGINARMLRSVLSFFFQLFCCLEVYYATMENIITGMSFEFVLCSALLIMVDA